MESDKLSLMVVAENGESAHQIQRLFPSGKIDISRESSIDRVLERFESESYDVLLITSVAFKAGELNGIELLEVITAKSPMTQILFLTEQRDMRIAMSALKAGTYQYMRLPVSDEELRLLIETAFEKRPRYGDNLLLETSKHEVQFEQLVGQSQPMREVYRQIRQAASTDAAVLLLGETGTGKDLAAKAIHQQSARSKGPYIPVNLGAVPTELVADELFGHEKGAFTGAVERRAGKFEMAHDGTAFMDEISSLDEKMQVSLLRLIEQKKFHRLGGTRSITSNARLVVASNHDLSDAIRQGTFREDLYYRLDVFRILMPPLRERQGDIPLLIDEFLKRYNQSFQKNILGISPECISLLESYGWHGNVRELKNVIQRAVLVCTGDVLLPEHLPPRFRPDHPVHPKVIFEIGTPLRQVEREMVIRALAVAQNNRKRAADILGISRRALYSKLHKHGIK